MRPGARLHAEDVLLFGVLGNLVMGQLSVNPPTGHPFDAEPGIWSGVRFGRRLSREILDPLRRIRQREDEDFVHSLH
jgi:hypothetical protein